MPIETVTDGKYLTFRQVDSKGLKTKIFSVAARGTSIGLGYVRFRPQWRCYTFHPATQTVFDTKCMMDIIGFIEEQNKDWRRSL